MRRRIRSRSLTGALALGLVVTAAATAQAAVSGGGSTDRTQQATVRVITSEVPVLATLGGVKIKGGAYGSAITMKPGSDRVFYGLTDRGPNVDAPDGGKIEPLPDFQPAIGEFELRKGNQAVLLRRIGLAAHDGTPYNGQVNPSSSTNETITDLDGHVLRPSENGYDPEGLVALKDGTFWASDEYGPFITHFGKKGRAQERLAPGDGLPAELSEREPNKGMEGLTITPDGSTLVGIMQNGLNAPDGPKSKNLSVVRIVTVSLRTRATHEYLYLLHNTDGSSTGVSEITALDSQRFLVDERDGNPEPGANKKLFLVDLSAATDVGPSADLAGATYDGANGGLLVGGKTIEAIAGKSNTATTQANLTAAGITPATSSLYLDVAGLVTAIDPSGGFFGHDKVEGVTVLDGPRGRASRLLISNDSDFGINGVNEATAPFTLKTKVLPNGQQDDGEFLLVDLGR